MKLRKLPIAALLAGLALPLAGCVEGVVVGAGAAATTAAMEERGFRGAVSDTAIRARINALWLDHSEEMLRRTGLRVNEGRVLLTGRLPDQQMRIDAVRLAWQADGVKEVINEIEVDNDGTLGSYARDRWITTQLVGKLAFDNRVSSINYSVQTVNRTVYLMGIAQDQAELDRVQNHARNLNYVRRVVSYVRLKDDPRRGST